MQNQSNPPSSHPLPIITYQRRKLSEQEMSSQSHGKEPILQGILVHELHQGSRSTMNTLQLFPSSPMIKTLLIKRRSGSLTELTGAVRLLDALKRKQEALSILRAEERDRTFPFQVPRRIPVFHLRLETRRQNMANHLIATFISQNAVVGMQLQVRYLRFLQGPREIVVQMTPLSLEDVIPIGMSEFWRDWEMYYLPLNPRPTDHPSVTIQRALPNLKMKFILWNVRGACRDEFIPHARHLVNLHHLAVFVFLETKSDDLRARQVMLQLGFHDFKAIEANDKRGGIWLFWKNTVDIVDFKEDFSFFHALFHFKNTNTEALVTGMHAPSTPKERHEMWCDMQSDLPPPNTPWLLFGDLNEVTSQNEKSGGRGFRHAQCRDMNNFTNAAGLFDMGYNGNPFTWSNAREGASLIKQRLDQALGNAAWVDQFPHTKDTRKIKGKEKASSSSGWEAPKEGYYKVNTDGAWMNSAMSSGGGVIRRSDGSWYVGFSCKYDAVSPFLAELYAMNDGLSIASDLDVKKVIVETDAKLLRDMLLTTGPNPHHELATTICDVAAVLSKFEVAVVTHIPREKNELAHRLAIFGRNMVVGYKTHYLFPDCVSGLYEEEKARVAATAT